MDVWNGLSYRIGCINVGWCVVGFIILTIVRMSMSLCPCDYLYVSIL